MLEKDQIINVLEDLDSGWPSDLWLYAANGTLYLMKNKSDGSRGILPNGGVDSTYIVETFINIECDGGDW